MDFLFVGIIITLVFLDKKMVIEEKNNEISIDQSNYVKGILSLIIFFHHFSPEVGGSIFSEQGALAVSVFFFLSAYGLTKGWLKKYSKQIICINIPQLILISLFSIIYKCIYLYLIGDVLSYKEIIIGALTGMKVLNWFFPVIILLYVLFALSIVISSKISMFSSSVKMVVCNIILVTILSGIFFYLFIKGIILLHWLISLYAFPLGIIVSVLESKKNYLKRSIFGIITLLFILLLFLSGYLNANGDSLIRMIKMLIYYTNSLIVCYLAYYLVQGKASKCVLGKIGSCSAEIILTQNMALTMFRNDKIYINNNIIYFLMTMITQVMLVIVLLPVYRWIKSWSKSLGMRY